MIIYFAATLFQEEETPYKIAKKVKNDQYVKIFPCHEKLNPLLKTNNIIISLVRVSSTVFTAKKRSNLLLTCLVLQLTIESIWFYIQKDEGEGPNIWLTSLVAVLIAKVFQAFHGHLLYHNYDHQDKKYSTHNKDIQLQEGLIIQKLDFYFYLIAFLITTFGWLLTIYLLNGQ